MSYVKLAIFHQLSPNWGQIKLRRPQQSVGYYFIYFYRSIISTIIKCARDYSKNFIEINSLNQATLWDWRFHYPHLKGDTSQIQRGNCLW